MVPFWWRRVGGAFGGLHIFAGAFLVAPCWWRFFGCACLSPFLVASFFVAPFLWFVLVAQCWWRLFGGAFFASAFWLEPFGGAFSVASFFGGAFLVRF